MKTLVVYYSYTGNTKNIAAHIAKELNADTAVIDTVTPYEGDYNAVVDQGQNEIRNGYKPPIKPINVDLSQYDTIILGTPVWWYTFAPAVKTFIESNDLSGKTIVPFATSGGSGMGKTNAGLAPSCRGAKLLDGKVFKMNVTAEELANWVKSLGI